MWNKRLADFTLNDLLNAALFFALVNFVGVLILSFIPAKLDDTDKDYSHRSGVAIVTDYGTGVQYLKTPEGYITPRLGVGK